MNELVEWLRGVLDEIERRTIRYRDEHPGEPCTTDIEGNPTGQYYSEYEPCERHIAAAEATPYRDAEFGLRQVEATRRILGEYATAAVTLEELEQDHDDAQYEWLPRYQVLGEVVKLLALPYAGLPGYREEWRP